MKYRKLLISLLLKLVLLAILLVLFVGAASAPISRAASCDTDVKICPTGTGSHAITEDDVIQYLINEPYLGHDTALVRFMSIQAFTYEPLSKTIYFQDMLSGTNFPSGHTPALSVTFCGIFSFGGGTPRSHTYTGYRCATIIFDVQTDEWLEITSAP